MNIDQFHLTCIPLRYANQLQESEVLKEDDNNWPAPDRVGRQELEIVVGNEHISFATTKLGSLMEVDASKDPEGLRVFYYLVQASRGQCVFRLEEEARRICMLLVSKWYIFYLHTHISRRISSASCSR